MLRGAGAICDDALMRAAAALTVVVMLTLPGATRALAQPEAEPVATPRFELSTPGPGPRETTRPRESEFYREDVRVPHEPAFVEPFTFKPQTGPVKKAGLALWTAPRVQGGARVTEVPEGSQGWFGFGFSLIWE